MASIITDKLRKEVAQLLLNEITEGVNNYHIGIGKADQYDSADTVITPIRSLREVRIARANLQSVKKVGASSTSFVIPRYNWISGSIYSGYSDFTVGIPTNSYYVITELNEVYMCIKQARNSLGVATVSTTQPNYSVYASSSDPTKTFVTPDGYWWKYMYTVTTARANLFLSANYIPIQFQTDSSGGSITGLDRDQALVQEAAVPGQIIGITLTSGGSGYSSAPTVIIRGNGTSAAATATISGGSVVKVEMNNESAALGSGYKFASIEFSGGSPTTAATARPIIGPRLGIGYDARDDLKSNSIMLNIKSAGDEGGDFLIGQDFRQIILFKNLEYKDSDALYSASTGKALRSITVDATPDFIADQLITGDTTGAKAYIDDISGQTVFYHQNENTGFHTFQTGELITAPGATSVTIVDASDSGGRGAEVDAFSGDVLYVENRAAIERTDAQTEDIKIVLTF